MNRLSLSQDDPLPIRRSLSVAAANVAKPIVRRSIFQNDWWLDAAAPGYWHRVETHWDNVCVGSMAFALRRRSGLRFIELPPFTRTLSPIIVPPESHPTHRLTNRVKILDSLMQSLPAHERFELCLEAGCETALPFVMLNYAVAHTYTFQTAEVTNLRSRMHQKTRNVVNKAARDFEVVNGDLDRFFALQRAHRGRIDVGAHHTVRRLYDAANSRNQASILISKNQRGEDCAASILVWDNAALFYWLSARHPVLSTNGANSLLIVRSVEKAAELGVMFDMDGFVTKTSGSFLAKFGMTPVVRPFVNNSSRVWTLMHLISSWGRARDDRHYRF